MCFFVCADWRTCRMAFWQMYRTSCIIYVCSFSYSQKPDVRVPISGSLRRKHVAAWRWKPNNNKQVFSVTNSSHFETNDKSTFENCWQWEPPHPQCSPQTWIYLFVSFLYQVDEGVSFCSKACAASRIAVLAGWHKALIGLNKQLWHMGRTFSAAWRPNSRGDEGLMEMKNLVYLFLMACIFAHVSSSYTRHSLGAVAWAAPPRWKPVSGVSSDATTREWGK